MSVCYRMRDIETEPIMTKERDDDNNDDDNGMVGVHEGGIRQCGIGYLNDEESNTKRTRKRHKHRDNRAQSGFLQQQFWGSWGLGGFGSRLAIILEAGAQDHFHFG